MSSLNDLWVTYLKGQGYTSNSLPDLMREALADQASSSSKNINDLWRDFLAAQGYTGSIPQALYDYLGSLGYSGNVNDRLVQSLTAGDFFGAGGASCSITLTGDIAAAAGGSPADISGQSFGVTDAGSGLYYASTPFESAGVRRPMPATGKKVWIQISDVTANTGVIRSGIYLFDGSGAPIGIVFVTAGLFPDIDFGDITGITTVSIYNTSTSNYDAVAYFTDRVPSLPSDLSLGVGHDGEVYFYDKASGSVINASDKDPAFSGFFSSAATMCLIGVVETYNPGTTASATFVTDQTSMIDKWAFAGDEDWCGNEITDDPVFTVAVTENTTVQWGAVDSTAGVLASAMINSNNATTNYYPNNYFDVTKWDVGDTVNTLLLFDGVSGIPSNATIKSASLRLKTYGSGSVNGNLTFKVGAYGTAPPPRFLLAESTWDDAATGVPWTTPGAWGDLYDTSADMYQGVNTTANTWYEWDITDYVTAAHTASPSSMSGVILLERADINEHGHADSYVGQTRRFRSEISTDGSRPELIIRYTVPA